MPRNTHALIDLQALSKNFDTISKLAPNSKQVVVVKADAYGNGAVAVANALKHKAEMFAVAFLDEAYVLREAGIMQPILVLQGPHEPQELESTDRMNIVWMLSSQHQLAWMSDWLDANQIDVTQKPIRQRHWLKFDTGMHRLGLMPDDYDKLKVRYARLFASDVVIATHLSAADEPHKKSVDIQLDQFKKMLGSDTNPLSIANSAANIHLSHTHQMWNRAGISLYGSNPFDDAQVQPNLAPVMHLNAVVIALRTIEKGESVGYGDTWVASKTSVLATIGIGYGDGYPRHAPIGTPAIINGHRVGLVGRVSMDMLIFDVSDFDDITIGSIAELWGATLNINTVANYVGTIGYELMTRISPRVPRIYKALG